MGSTDPEEGAGLRATSRGWSCEGSQRHTALAQHMHGDGVFLSVLHPSLVHDSQSLIGSYKYFKRDLEGIIKKLHNWLPYKGGDRLQTVGKGMRLFLFHSFKWF